MRPLHADVLDTQTGRRAVYQICTAVSIDTVRRAWLTAAHCVSHPPGHRYLVSEWSIDRHAAMAIRIDNLRDLAILVTADYAMPALILASTGPEFEDEITIVGYPLASPSLVISSGSVVSPETLIHVNCNLDAVGRQRPYMVVTAEVWPGSSGSPIVNASGHIVGIVQVGCHYEQWPVGGGSPYVSLHGFLASALWPVN